MLRTWCRGEVRFEQIPLWDARGINFPHIMAALEGIDYRGYVTVHQAGLDTPAADAAASARYLRSIGRFDAGGRTHP